MAHSPNWLPSIPTNPSKLHRIYSNSEEKFIEKTVLYTIKGEDNAPLVYLYINPDGGDVPENRVDKQTLMDLFCNGLLIDMDGALIQPLAAYDNGNVAIISIPNTKDIIVDSKPVTVYGNMSFYSMEFNNG